MFNSGAILNLYVMPLCDECGTRMSCNDQTTKLTEYACPECHSIEIVRKGTYRVTA